MTGSCPGDILFDKYNLVWYISLVTYHLGVNEMTINRKNVPLLKTGKIDQSYGLSGRWFGARYYTGVDARQVITRRVLILTLKG